MRHKGFILPCVLLLLILSMLLALEMLQGLLLHEKFQQQLNKARIGRLQALQGLLLEAKTLDLQNEVTPTSTWQPIEVPGQWPPGFSASYQLQVLDQLTDDLSFAPSSAISIYYLTVREIDRQAILTYWQSAWWHRSETNQALAGVVQVNGYYTTRLKAWPALQASYQQYQAAELQQPIAYQVNAQAQLMALQQGKTLAVYPLLSRVGQQPSLQIIDVYLQNHWQSLLLVTWGNHFWLLQWRGHQLHCLWQYTDASALQLHATAFRASNHNWVLLLSANDPARILGFDLLSGKAIVSMLLPKSIGQLSPITVIDSQQQWQGDYAYVGDEQGHLWLIDLSALSPQAWQIRRQPLFSAHKAPITLPPLLATAEDGGIRLYLIAGNILYGLKLQEPDQLSAEPIHSMSWPTDIIDQPIEAQAWKLQSPSGMNISEIQVRGNRLWLLVQGNHSAQVVVVNRLNGAAPTLPVFVENPHAASWTLQPLSSDHRLQFWQQHGALMLSTLGQVIAIAHNPDQHGLQNIHEQ